MFDIVRFNIQLTKKCNQRCLSCNSYNLFSHDECSFEDFKRAIVEVGALFPIQNIAFTGGEPSTFENILDISSFARKHSRNVSITTNGYYCTTKERMRDLVSAGINRFSFSYHGVGVHDAFTRTLGAEARLTAAIEYLSTLENVYVKIGSLFTGRNIETIETMLQFAEQKGIDLYVELLESNIPLFSNHLLKEMCDEAGLALAIAKMKDWIRQKRRVLLDEKALIFIEKWFSHQTIEGECPLWRTDLYLESNGDVRTGCWFLAPIGNIREEPIGDLIKGRRYKENIEAMKHRNCPGCTCGYLMQSKYLLE